MYLNLPQICKSSEI